MQENNCGILEMYMENVKKFPEKVAIETTEENISYRQLNQLSDDLVLLMKNAGIRDGTIVNVIMPQSINLIVVIISVFKLKAIFLPIDLEFSKKRLQNIFKNSYDGFIVSTNSLRGEIESISMSFGFEVDNLIFADKTFSIEQKKEKLDISFIKSYVNPEFDNLSREINEYDFPCYLYYTSGSTGDGKGILGSYLSLSHFISWEKNQFKINTDCRVSQLTQITFDPFFRDIFLPLCSGGTLIIPPIEIRKYPNILFEWLIESKVNVMHCVPSLFRLINEGINLNQESRRLSELKLLIFAGEMLYFKELLNWKKILGSDTKIINFYGPSETTLAKLFYEVPENYSSKGGAVPVGKAISESSVAILNDNHICRVGEIGEVYIKSKYISYGYWKEQEQNNKHFVQNPLNKEKEDIVYRTGDLGKYLKDGNIELIGRVDNQIKFNGIRVELDEIEDALLGINGINEVVVKGELDESQNINIVAYYTGVELNQQIIVKHLRESININIIPSEFNFIKTFPRNINGKIDRSQLKFSRLNIVTPNHDLVSPSNNIEFQLMKIWTEILGKTNISTTDSFFESGGNSLKAILLIAKIHKEFKIDPKKIDIFKNSSIISQGKMITECTEYLDGNSIIPVDKIDLSKTLSLENMQLYKASYQQIRCYNDITSNYLGNIIYQYSFAEPIDANKLKNVIIDTVKELEVFRTTFHKEDNGLVARVIKLNAVPSNCIEFSEKSDPEIASSLKLVKFELDKFPLFKFILKVDANHCHSVHLCLSHIIFDGFSSNLLVKYILDKYNGLSNIVIQYSTYANWQQLNYDKFLLSEYWIDSIGKDHPKILYNPNNNSIKALKVIWNKRNSISLNVVISIFSEWIKENLKLTDLLIQYSSIGRSNTNAEFFDCMGCFINLMLIRIKNEFNLSSDESIELIRTKLENNIKNEVGFEDILKLNNIESFLPFYINFLYSSEEIFETNNDEILYYDPKKSYLTTFKIGIFTKVYKSHIMTIIEYDENYVSKDIIISLLSKLKDGYEEM